MKVKIKLVSLAEAGIKPDICVQHIYNNKIFNLDHPRLITCKTLIGEYEVNTGFKQMNKQLPIAYSDWQYILDNHLIDKEVEGEIGTYFPEGIKGMASIANHKKESFQAIKLIPPKQEEKKMYSEAERGEI